MKKTTMQNIANFLRNYPEMATEVNELTAELARGEEKAQANRELYAAAHDVVMSALTDTPTTVADWFKACEDRLPEGFTKSKMQYALREYWNNEVVKIEGKVNSYRKA